MNAVLDGWSIDGATVMHAWAIATAATVAAACALVGTLLVVRRMSLLGDAIGHAVLPGIAVAVLAGGRPGGPLVFAAAVATGLLTVWLTRLVRSAGSLSDDAGTGVVFTTLFPRRGDRDGCRITSRSRSLVPALRHPRTRAV